MHGRQLPAIVAGAVVLAALAFIGAGLALEDSLPARLLAGGGLRPGPGQPTSRPVVVDGDTGEWVLADDLFADLYRAGQENEKVQARLYLRYDCASNLVYALLLSAGDWPILQRRSLARLALDSADEQVSLVDLSWIEPGYDGNGQHARGWEASCVASEGEHVLWVTSLVMDEGQIQAASTLEDGVLVALECNEHATLFLSRLEAIPIGGRIRLEWETAWEVNNQGFNVYHSSSREGPWTRLNRDLIASRSAPPDTTGAQYEYIHAGVDLGAENYYLLEDLSGDGMATRHGPISP